MGWPAAGRGARARAAAAGGGGGGGGGGGSEAGEGGGGGSGAGCGRGAGRAAKPAFGDCGTATPRSGREGGVTHLRRASSAVCGFPLPGIPSFFLHLRMARFSLFQWNKGISYVQGPRRCKPPTRTPISQILIEVVNLILEPLGSIIAPRDRLIAARKRPR